MIDLDITRRVFQSLTVHERSIIALNMVGGFQTEATKMKWNDESQGLCEICGQIDDRPHRILSCCAWEATRQKHVEAVELLRGECSDWVYLSLARKHEEVDVLNIILNARQPPDPVQLQTTTQPEGKVHFRLFTDGACVMPTDPSCRRASWAVIQDTAETESQRIEQGQSVQQLNNHTRVPNLACVAVSLLHRAQSAARAELMAVLYALACVVLTGSIRFGRNHY